MRLRLTLSMSVNASVSVSAQQDAYAHDLVDQGRFPSFSAVVRQGLDPLRKRDEGKQLEMAALRVLLEERLAGPFVSARDFGDWTGEMLRVCSIS